MRKLWPYLLAIWLLTGSAAGAWGAFWLETTTDPANLVPRNGSLFFSDASEAPVKRIDLQDGRLVPLARRMGTPIRFCLRGEDLFWVETRPGSTGDCTGTQTVQILTGIFAGGLQTVELARGSNCGSGTHEIIARGDILYWVTSTVSPDTYRIEKVPLTGAAPSVIYNAGWNPITALAADETHLYWTEGRYPDPGVVKRMPLAGGAAEVVYADTLPVSAVLAVDDGYVIFADMGFPNAYRLLKAPLTGGDASVLVHRTITDPVAGRQSITHIAVAADSVVWCDAGSIQRTSVSDGQSAVLVENLTLAPTAIALGANRVYWSQNTGPAHGQTGTIKSVSLAGTAIQVHVQGGDAPFQIAVQDDQLYWNEGGDIGAIEGFGRIARIPLAGGPVTTLAAGVSVTRPPIAVDDTHVYIADRFRIKKVPVCGGPPETVVAADFEIKDLAVDGGALYWTEEPFCAVKKAGVDGGALTLLDTGSGPAGPLQVSGGVVYWMDNFSISKRSRLREAPFRPLPPACPTWMILRSWEAIFTTRSTTAGPSARWPFPAQRALP